MNRTKTKVEVYRSVLEFQIGVESEYKNGYSLHSWNINVYEVVAVFISAEACIEFARKVVDVTGEKL